MMNKKLMSAASIYAIGIAVMLVAATSLPIALAAAHEDRVRFNGLAMKGVVRQEPQTPQW